MDFCCLKTNNLNTFTLFFSFVQHNEIRLKLTQVGISTYLLILIKYEYIYSLTKLIFAIIIIIIIILFI